MLRIKLLAVTGLAAIVPGVSHFVGGSADRLDSSPELPEASGSPDPESIQSVALDAAREHRVDPGMVLSILAIESAFLPDSMSPKGALGLMQVMPATARALGYDPRKWQENIEAGTVYLADLLGRYRHRKNGVELALAAYNAGPSAVAKYGGVPPFPETRLYVKRVLARYRSKQWMTPREPLLSD